MLSLKLFWNPDPISLFQIEVKKFLNLERSLFERYAENYEIIQAIRVAEDREPAESLKEQRSQESDGDF